MIVNGSQTSDTVSYLTMTVPQVFPFGSKKVFGLVLILWEPMVDKLNFENRFWVLEKTLDFLKKWNFKMFEFVKIVGCLCL